MFFALHTTCDASCVLRGAATLQRHPSTLYAYHMQLLCIFACHTGSKGAEACTPPFGHRQTAATGLVAVLTL